MNARRLISTVLCVLGVALVFASVPAVAGASKGVVGFFGGSGTTGGLFNTPGGVAVNDTSGNVYAVDSGNDRVQEFSAGGAFIRAWGLGVVAAGQDGGGTSTVQRVVIVGTGGTFTLSFAGQTTSAIAYDAPSSSVEVALDALSTIGGVGGSVAVVGEGSGISPYEVTFGGSFQGGAVAQMTLDTSGLLGFAVGTQLNCVAGPTSPPTQKTFQWLRNGVAIVGATSSRYTTVAQDEGDVVQCQVFEIDATAGSTQVSAATAVVAPASATVPPVAPGSIAEPTITAGALTVGGPGGARLSCATGAWTGASTFSYQWYRNGVALSGNGADTSTYTVQGADLGSAAVFQCAVTGTDAGGSVTLVSANLATEPQPAAPVARVTMTVPVLGRVATLTVGAPAFEVCNAASSPQDVCKAGIAGSVAGAMSAPQGIAIEQVTGDVYVTDQGNRRVDEFTEAGVFRRAFGWGVETGAAKPQVCTTTCETGLSGANAGEFGASIGYPAVDPTTGDVYVADPANSRVQVFEGDGVFKRAFGWGVADGAGEFQICTSSCQAGVVSASEFDLGRFATGSPTRVAVDASGNVYVVDGGAPDFRVQKFASVSKENAPLAEFFASAQLTGSSSVTAPSDVAVEPTLGNVLAAREPSTPAEHLLYEVGSGGALLGTYAEGAALPAPQGLAVGSSDASVYFSTAANNRVFVLGTLVAPTAGIESVTNPTASEATLHGTIDPEETPPNGIETTWQFEYSTNDVEWTPLSGGKLAASTSPVAVTQTVTGLEGHTLYDVRLHASKEFAAGSATSATVQFTTSATAPTVSDEAVTQVAATSARLSAQINSQHLDTTYHFEYDTVPYTTSAMHGTSLPVPDEDIGAGVSAVLVSQEPRVLKPGTTYHYRVVATNANAEVTDGSEHAFTTQTTGTADVLPDGRAWEMVSPPNKGGALIEALGAKEEGGVSQAAADGGAFTWIAETAVGSEPAGNLASEASQIFSVRGVGGWSSRDIAPPHDGPSTVTLGHGSEYLFFSSNLSLGLVEPIGPGNTPLSPQATEKTLYLRDDMGDSYLPLVTPANTPPGIKITKEEPFGDVALLEFEGATPDLSHVLFYGPADLDPNYPGVGGLYEWGGGQPQLVNVLPDGEPAAGVGHLTNSRPVISNDGSRVIWNNGGMLYMRNMVKGETILLGDGSFQTASEDDHRVFFTTGPDLDVFETIGGEDEPLKGAVTDLTVDHNAGESAGVEGVLPGASKDGSYVYLVATGVLSEAANSEREKAASGSNNLYVLHDASTGWETTFIAQLSGEDAPDWTGGARGYLERLTSRVSTDGRYFAFMSDRELTGYDNHDANSGAADEEVFLYDAGTERLVCASCNSTGALPVGVFDHVVLHNGHYEDSNFDQPGTWAGSWLAANIPGWTPALGEGDGAFYQSRYLSNNGRLFFNSSDALVPQDVNGTEDVYEFEPSGIGSCTDGDSTFSGVRGGCVSLISSGTSADESVFLDASEGGGDVFFLTAAKLVVQDYDTSLDVYDAHECTMEIPCVSAPASSPECTTTDACRTAPTPQPSIFGAPASATFSGVGNSAPAPAIAKAKAKAKPLTRAQKLADALKGCKKKKSKMKRSVCEKRARKQYGAPQKPKKQKAKKTSREGK